MPSSAAAIGSKHLRTTTLRHVHQRICGSRLLQASAAPPQRRLPPSLRPKQPSAAKSSRRLGANARQPNFHRHLQRPSAANAACGFKQIKIPRPRRGKRFGWQAAATNECADTRFAELLQSDDLPTVKGHKNLAANCGVQIGPVYRSLQTSTAKMTFVWHTRAEAGRTTRPLSQAKAATLTTSCPTNA